MKYQTINKPSAATYYATFEELPAGQLVLAELLALFYNRESFDRNSTHVTSYNEGQRAVIQYILNRISSVDDEQQEEGNNND